jgi:hypothetical protein
MTLNIDLARIINKKTVNNNNLNLKWKENKDCIDDKISEIKDKIIN